MKDDVFQKLEGVKSDLMDSGDTMAAHFIECAIEVLEDSCTQPRKKEFPRLVVNNAVARNKEV